MKIIKKVTIPEIQDIAKNNNIEWDGKELDGSVMEDIFQENSYITTCFKKEWIRTTVNRTEDGNSVILLNKKAIDKAITKNRAMKYDIRLRIAQRAKSNYDEDYFDFYYDLIDPILYSIDPKIKDLISGDYPYLNIYDYIIDSFYSERAHTKLMDAKTPEHEVI